MKTSNTYAGIPEEYAGYDKSQIVVIPVPYDEQVPGVREPDKGPEAF